MSVSPPETSSLEASQTTRSETFRTWAPLVFSVIVIGIILFCAVWSIRAVILNISYHGVEPIQVLKLYLIIGLAFVLVTIFKATDGPVSIEMGGVVKFKGSSGPIIMWILSFLSMCFGLKLLGLT
jgi:hypothetical protein